jgi:arylsulfatase A-like enzyme
LVAHNPLFCFTKNIRLNEEEIIALKALYDGEVSYLDHKIGELIEFLKRNHTYDNTLIIVTADHGEHFGEHDLYSHVASLYEPILHIPLIIKYPEWIHKRARISELAQLIDIYPTVIEALDLDPRFLKGVQGTSLFETNKTAKYHDYIIAEWEGRIPDFVMKRMKNSDGDSIVDKFREPMSMIREGRYKYILNSKGREELYDLDNDKREVNNISEKKNEIRKRLREKLTQWQSLNNRVDYEKQSRLDEATKKNLKNLGYM